MWKLPGSNQRKEMRELLKTLFLDVFMVPTRSTNIACLKRWTSLTERELKPTNYLLNSWFSRHLLHERMNSSRIWTTSNPPHNPPTLIDRCLLSLFRLRNSKSLVRHEWLGMCHSDPLGGKKNRDEAFCWSTHTTLDSGRRGRWNRPNRACKCNVPPDGEREGETEGPWVYPHRASDTLMSQWLHVRSFALQ